MMMFFCLLSSLALPNKSIIANAKIPYFPPYPIILKLFNAYV